jgi:thymidylate synthase (FAD)
MKIVPASFEILDHLDQQSLAVRIEECGRICYKSEDRITPESALPFVKNVIERGHNSVLEMGVVTLEVCCSFWDYFDLLETVPKYLCLSKVMPDGDRVSGMDMVRLLITGSIRAWREILINHQNCEVARTACTFLGNRHPYFFDSILPEGGFAVDRCMSVRKVSLKDVDDLPVELMVKHRHVSVKLVVSRAISHQLVRHRPASYLQESMRYCNYASGKFGNEATFIKPLFWEEETEEYDTWKRAVRDAERVYKLLIETSTPQAARTVLPNSCKTEIIVYANLEQWRHIFKLRCSKAAEPSMREVMVPLREEFVKRWPEVLGNE